MTSSMVAGVFEFKGPLPLKWCILSSQGDQGREAALVAFNSQMVQVAMMRWDAPDRPNDPSPTRAEPLGELRHVEVTRPWRRHGVATAMWNMANEIANELKWVPPGHSPRRTPDGDAWARAVGGHLPDLDAIKAYEHLPPADDSLRDVDQSLLGDIQAALRSSTGDA